MIVDLSEIKKLERAFLSRGGDDFYSVVRWGAAGALTSTAVRTRLEIQEELKKELVWRSSQSRNLMRAMVRFVPARGGDDINVQSASAGSLDKTRFTGWVEQEQIQPDQRKRHFVDAARVGKSAGRVVSRKYRFYPSKRIERLKGFSRSTTAARVAVQTRIWQKEGGDHEFILDSMLHPKLQRGVWMYSARGNKLIFVALLPNVKKKVRPVLFVRKAYKKALRYFDRNFIVSIERAAHNRLRYLKRF